MRRTPYTALHEAAMNMRLTARKYRLLAYHAAMRTRAKSPVGNSGTMESLLHEPARIAAELNLMIARGQADHLTLREHRNRAMPDGRYPFYAGGIISSVRPPVVRAARAVDTALWDLRDALLRHRPAGAAQHSMLSVYNAVARLNRISHLWKRKAQPPHQDHHAVLAAVDAQHLAMIDDVALPDASWAALRPGHPDVAAVAASSDVGVLADAIEDYGLVGPGGSRHAVATAMAVTHLRGGQDHFEGCWVCDLCLGREVRAQ